MPRFLFCRDIWIQNVRGAYRSYILVTDSEFGDAECMILKDKAGADNTDSIYEFVEDDVELHAVFKIFDELLEDVDIEL